MTTAAPMGSQNRVAERSARFVANPEPDEASDEGELAASEPAGPI